MQLGQTQLIERLLDHLINPYDCIDIYERSYLDDLENVLIENHSFDFQRQKFPDDATQKWFQRVLEATGTATMEQLLAYIRSHAGQLQIANVRPRTDLHLENVTEWVPAFDELKPGAIYSEQHRDAQRLYSTPAINVIPGNDLSGDNYELYLGWDRLNPWTYLIRREIKKGNISRDDATVCIGNRWLGEILYFRENIGLRKTTGLDVFSSNPVLVQVGDMHKMPFADGSVKLVFIRQALSKSFDVRIVIKEILRVLCNDGFFIIEIPGPYGWGVNRLRGSDVKSAQNLIRLFRGKVRRIIYKDEMQVYSTCHEDDVHHVIRVFAQIDKNQFCATPIEEVVHSGKLKRYVQRRQAMLRARVKARIIAGKLPRGPKRVLKRLLRR